MFLLCMFVLFIHCLYCFVVLCFLVDDPVLSLGKVLFINSVSNFSLHKYKRVNCINNYQISDPFVLFTISLLNPLFVLFHYFTVTTIALSRVIMHIIVIHTTHRFFKYITKQLLISFIKLKR